uniref:Urea transport system substrate-binding protein n=1 Tax=Candidatus Kentrum sp. LFY TaxID=2126342 RepID=A0A450WDA5_9GAMM|nr:MAG: urea transport system substrate-binding protein [Candidatus Kentron sp. LFY]
MKKSRFGYVVLLLGAMLVACSNDQTSDVKFKVGVIADRTGFMSGHGQSTEMGAKLAADTLNRNGGILGTQIELIVLDGQSNPAVTANRARELLQQHKVSLLLGTGTSAATLAAIGPATESKIPFIYSLDGEIKTCAPGSDGKRLNPYVFASGFSERMAVGPLLNFLVSKVDKPTFETSIYFVGGDYVYPRTTNRYAINVAKSLGMRVVGEEYSDTATADYSPVIRKIQEAKPDILIMTNPGASGVTFMRQAKQFALDQQMLISGFATFDQEAIDAMGDLSDGVYVINRYSNQLVNAKNNDFVSAFRSQYSDEDLLPGPTAAAGAYGALITAAEAAKYSHDVSAAGVLSGLSGLDVDLPQGKISVSRSNHMFNQKLYIMEIANKSYKIVETTDQLQHPDFDGCSVR